MRTELDAKRRRIGPLLRDIREKRNIGQESAAKAIGISRTHLSNIEVGRSAPGLQRLQAMCAFYKVETGPATGTAASLTQAWSGRATDRSGRPPPD